MAYYILNKGFQLRGWKGLPFGLRYPNMRFTDFFDKESYRVVYALDGRHDIDEASLTEKQKKLLDHLKEVRIAMPSDGTARLDPDQVYSSYPGMYKNSVQWSITGRCNFKCRHCFMSAPEYKGEDLTLEQSIHILDELKENGIFNISITGGEPLVNPHFFAILDAMKERGLILDTIYSNGELVSEALLDELEKRQMHPNFHMSFDGVGWHDWLRGVEGAEEMVIRKFKLLKDRGYATSTSMCLHRHNIGSLRETINLMASLGLNHVKMNVASPTGLWKNESEHFLTQDEANEAILAYIPQYIADGMPISAQFCGMLEFNKNAGQIRIPYVKYPDRNDEYIYACGVVKSSMYISPTGKVLPCMTMGGTAIDSKFDSVLEKPLSEILSDSFYRNTCLISRNQCIEHNEKCRDCEYRWKCGAGCRAAAVGETGLDYMTTEEEACHFFKAGWYEKALEVIEQYKDCFPKPAGQPDAPAEEERC